MSTPPKSLTGKQRRQLRAMGHHLNPTLVVGKEGASEELLAQTEIELEAHELIKIRVLESAPEDVDEIARHLAERCRAHLAQVIGHTALLYRARSDKPTIELQ